MSLSFIICPSSSTEATWTIRMLLLQRSPPTRQQISTWLSPGDRANEIQTIVQAVLLGQGTNRASSWWALLPHLISITLGKRVAFLFSFYRWGNWDPNQWRNLVAKRSLESQVSTTGSLPSLWDHSLTSLFSEQMFLPRDIKMSKEEPLPLSSPDS